MRRTALLLDVMSVTSFQLSEASRFGAPHAGIPVRRTPFSMMSAYVAAPRMSGGGGYMRPIAPRPLPSRPWKVLEREAAEGERQRRRNADDGEEASKSARPSGAIAR